MREHSDGPASRSILRLAVGGLPAPARLPTGEWCYRHAVRPPGTLSELDRQTIVDFLDYETSYGRSVGIEWDGIHPDLSAPARRPHPGLIAKQCCTHAYPLGCGGALVCHGTTVQAAADVLRTGALLAGTERTGSDPVALATQAGSWDPPDYFDYICMANGSCTAPEAVAESRRHDRYLVPSDLQPGYPPAVRFYFRWERLLTHPNVRFDGVHPVKIAGHLDLDEYLTVVVVHSSQAPEIGEVPRRLAQRVAVVDLPTPSAPVWALAASRSADAKAAV
jgi:hypothetical protein